jgi:hypothetical protein
MTYTTQIQVRKAFWFTIACDVRKPYKYWGKSQNDLPADVRMAFVDFVDRLARDGDITEGLAGRVTL